MTNISAPKYFALAVLFLSSTATLLLATPRAIATAWVSTPTLTKMYGDRWQVRFELDTATDVEVAIINTSTSEVVRHLAAGVLGASPPPPLLANSLSQMLVWDGRDDYQQIVANVDNLSVRVRAGTRIQMDKIVGGDPYGWFSNENDSGDHSAWSMKQAIDVKSDGSVYIYGNTGALGSPMIRRYDAMGNYMKTVFPFPAGLAAADVEGWGIRVKGDGTYAPEFSSFTFDPTITDSYVVSRFQARTSTLLPNRQNTDQLTVMTTPYRDGFDDERLALQTFNTDGTTSTNSKSGRLINNPSLPASDRIGGNLFTTYSKNGNYIYISSLYDKTSYADASNFYREGQVFKVSVATGTATSFYSQGSALPVSPGVNREIGYSQLHGVAVDAEDNVFVCDRQNSRIVVLSPQGAVLRYVPVARPDNVAISDAGVMYVTTRDTSLNNGNIHLHKFTNWRTDNSASSTVFISRIIPVPGLTDVEVVENNGDPRIWVTYPSAPVKIFRDEAAGLVLTKDFSQVNTQTNLSINAIVVDSKNETLYVTDGYARLFKVDNWVNPVFKRIMVAENKILSAGSVAIDVRNRYLYARAADYTSTVAIGPIRRWNADSTGYYTPVNNLAGSNVVTDNTVNFWSIRVGLSDRGFDVTPDGGLVLSGGIGGSTYVSYLKYFNRDETKTPWEQLTFDSRSFSSARSDLNGNVYAALYDGPPTSVPIGYENDLFYKTDRWNQLVSRIYKFAPTGTAQSGNLYPYAPEGPVKIYDVAYGMTARERPSSFGVDGYGRIAYPTAISQTVTLIDNAGNEILDFGTYGNADSKGGLAGELVATDGIPLAYGHTVDISDNYIYVGDLNNNRVIRVAMKHALVHSISTLAAVPDSDDDGVLDANDNCPLIPNAGQRSTANASRGDACINLPPGC